MQELDEIRKNAVKSAERQLRDAEERRQEIEGEAKASAARSRAAEAKEAEVVEKKK